MAYALIDDQLTDHPKIMQAGPLAGWLYVCGLAYCTRLLTDGFIPAGQVHKLADIPAADVTALVTRLVTARLWDETEGGYRVHDFLRHNPSAADVREKRQKAAERQERWRRSHLGDSLKEGSNGVSHASPDAYGGRSRNAVTNSSPRPRPYRDIPTPTESVPDADAPAETRREQPVVRTNPAPKPKPSGVSLAPLAEEFAARGLEFPAPKTGREVQAAQALLRRGEPEQIAACWAQVVEGEYGADFDQKRLSFAHLADQRFFENWLLRAAGKMRPPQRREARSTRGAGAVIAGLQDELEDAGFAGLLGGDYGRGKGNGRDNGRMAAAHGRSRLAG